MQASCSHKFAAGITGGTLGLIAWRCFCSPVFWEGYPLVFGGLVMGWFFVLEFEFCLGCGWIRLWEAGKVFLGCDLSILFLVFGLPLTRTVEFRAVLQRGNRVQVPKLVRWEFKLEPSQVLRIRVGRVSVYGRSEYFFGRMNKDGRITVPKLTVDLLEDMFEGESLVGKVLEVQLAPSGSAGS
jgi:hypothetical protein